MKRKGYLGLIIILILISGCNYSSGDESFTAIEEEQIVVRNAVEEVQNQYSQLEKRLVVLEKENKSLIEDNIDLRNELSNVYDELDDIKNAPLDGRYIPYHMLGIIDGNIKVLYDNSNIDPYYYFNPYFELRAGHADTLDDLMDYYSYRLDASYSEGFSGYLGGIYRDMNFQDFVDELTEYPDDVIDSLTKFLIFDIGYRDDALTILEEEISDLGTDYDKNYVINSLKIAIDWYRQNP